jgi:hypothetical protein
MSPVGRSREATHGVAEVPHDDSAGKVTVTVAVGTGEGTESVGEAPGVVGDELGDTDEVESLGVGEGSGVGVSVGDSDGVGEVLVMRVAAGGVRIHARASLQRCRRGALGPSGTAIPGVPAP